MSVSTVMELGTVKRDTNQERYEPMCVELGTVKRDTNQCVWHIRTSTNQCVWHIRTSIPYIHDVMQLGTVNAPRGQEKSYIHSHVYTYIRTYTWVGNGIAWHCFATCILLLIHTWVGNGIAWHCFAILLLTDVTSHTACPHTYSRHTGMSLYILTSHTWRGLMRTHS
jgi:hypothetical protein